MIPDDFHQQCFIWWSIKGWKDKEKKKKLQTLENSHLESKNSYLGVWNNDRMTNSQRDKKQRWSLLMQGNG